MQSHRIFIVTIIFFLFLALGASILWFVFRNGYSRDSEVSETGPFGLGADFEIPEWYYTDKDGDGLTDDEERELGTNPYETDTDGDGLSDYDEIHFYGTDPLNPDTDGDGYSDGYEIIYGTDPLNPHSFPENEF